MMNENIDLKNKKSIYMVCPSNNKTGGTELLHQLANQLSLIGKNAYIAYYFEGNARHLDPTPEAFKQYKFKSCELKSIEDSSDNLVIFPEVAIGKHRRFKHIQKSIWWLSVDNYFASMGKMKRLKRYGVLSFLKHILLNDYIKSSDISSIDVHFYQSYFAADFLNKQGIPKKNTYYLSDYINDIYLNNFTQYKKSNIVIYNPKKGLVFTEKLINSAPDISWKPIMNMTNQQVVDLMRNAKVYIDFGNHPGKDRIPREAAMSGCCVITNKKGSAAFQQDVPIPEKYKFNDSEDNIKTITNTIRECLNNYPKSITDFSTYRNYIRNEKEEFRQNVAAIFK